MPCKQTSLGLSKLVGSPWTSVGQGILQGWGNLKGGRRMMTCSLCVQEDKGQVSAGPNAKGGPVPIPKGNSRAVPRPGCHFSQGKAKG